MNKKVDSLDDRHEGPSRGDDKGIDVAFSVTNQSIKLGELFKICLEGNWNLLVKNIIMHSISCKSFDFTRM